MPYSEALAIRIREALSGRRNVEEKKMFGGLAFMVAGSMACGIIGNDLMARVGKDNYESALARPHASKMEFTGRPLKGFIIISAEGIRTATSLKTWVDEAVAFAHSLKKEAGKKTTTTTTTTTTKKQPKKKTTTRKKRTTRTTT